MRKRPLGEARRGSIPAQGSVTEEQRSPAAFSAKTRRAAGLLAAARVGSAVTARCGDAPASPPWPQPKSFAAGPHAILKQALRVIVVMDLFYSSGLASSNPAAMIVSFPFESRIITEILKKIREPSRGRIQSRPWDGRQNEWPRKGARSAKVRYSCAFCAFLRLMAVLGGVAHSTDRAVNWKATGKSGCCGLGRSRSIHSAL